MTQQMQGTGGVDAIVTKHKTWFMILGVILIILGIVAIIFPLLTTIVAKIFFGWLLLIGGVLQVVHAFSTQKWSAFFFALLVGILYVLVGGWLAFFPLTGIITLTILLAATFVAQGVLELLMAFKLRPMEGWVWVLLAGLLGLIAGVLILAQLPSSAIWAIGLLTGVNLLSSGWAYFFLAQAAGRKA